VIAALSSKASTTTIDDLNTHFQVGAGGFAGDTNPSYVYTVIDSGPNAASLSWTAATVRHAPATATDSPRRGGERTAERDQ
jgi:hypothetical protein